MYVSVAAAPMVHPAMHCSYLDGVTITYKTPEWSPADNQLLLLSDIFLHFFCHGHPEDNSRGVDAIGQSQPRSTRG
jgi:hypothetical protein